MSAESVAATPSARRALGSTGLLVSPLCVGGAEFGNVPVLEYEVPEDRALATLRAVFDSPLNFLDTGASYGQGESERRIGLALRELGGLPPGFVLATKADRDLQFLFGFLILAFLHQQRTQVAADDGVMRSERAGLPHLGNGLVGAAGSAQGRRQIAGEARVVGPPPSGSLKHLDGLCRGPLPQ